MSATAAGEALAPWQERVYARACEAIDRGRLAHGLLFCGPALIGKRAVAERLAGRLLCEAADDASKPCGACRGCRLYAVRSQEDPPAMRPDGRLVHPWGLPGHPDLMFVGHAWNEKASPPRMRAEIVIEQMRAIPERLALTPQYGGAQVVLVDPADAINHAAANALLKTLEEPQDRRYLWLLSAEPARLPATIRSRCQKLEFRLPPRDEAQAWLQAQGHPAKAAGEALDAARGHPGLAHAWLQRGDLALRREVAGDLSQLADGRQAVVATAQRWTADEQADLRLRFAADLALEQANALANQLTNQAAAGLTDPARGRRLAAWFDAANRTRDLLRTTVRADLAVAELLLAWREGMAPANQRHPGRR